MADGYGVDVSVPNSAGPSQLPAAQGTPPPQNTPAPSGPFNLDSLSEQFGKIPSQAPQPSPQPQQQSAPQFADQGAQTPAIGSASQIAQANIGRNVNERLQIWSNLVGNNNAVIGPNSDVWIRGQDSKFHPADSDHTNMLQDVAKKSGAGIDMVTMALTDLATTAAGTGAGFLAGGPPGAVMGAKVGAITGLMAGPGLGSAGRQFIESRLYGVQPDKEQLKRDFLIGGAINTFTGGIMSGMGFGPQLMRSGVVGTVADNIAASGAESAAQRSVKIARSQVAAKQFFDSVGAEPSPIIGEGGEINTSLSQAGDNIKGAVDVKRQNLNSAIEEARNIIVSSPGKPNTLPLAQGIRGKLIDEGVRFDEHSMPIDPGEKIPITASPVTNDVYGPKPFDPFATSQGQVVGQTTRRAAMQMSPAVDQLIGDYQACVSGQMDKDSYLDMIKRWQSDSQFKVFETRPDAEVASWRQLQRMGVEHRNGMISDALQGQPQQLANVQKAYSDYRATTDALDLVDQNFKQAKNSPEALAQSFFQPGQKELLSQFQSAFKDNPKLINDTRAAWLGQKMSNHVNQDGVFNSSSFIKDLQSLGGESLSQVFKPQELATLKRSATIFGSVKSSDLTSPAQGQAIAESTAELAKSTRGNWGALLDWFKGHPKYADYVSSSGGLDKLAAQNISEDASRINSFKSALRNQIVGNKVLGNMPTNLQLATSSVPLNARQIGAGLVQNSNTARRFAPYIGMPAPATPAPQGTTGMQQGLDEASK